jgi:hypothetical protein
MPQILSKEAYSRHLVQSMVDALRAMPAGSKTWSPLYGTPIVEFLGPRSLEFPRVPEGWTWHVLPMIRMQFKLGLEFKPRMWFCPKERVHMCIRNGVLGRGTTRAYAYQQMVEKESG